jgi:regulator of protease activity HflC (stomatin/prohibitin superfamily)
MSSLPEPDLARDLYRGVFLVLLAAAILGALAALVGGVRLANPVILAAAITMGIAAGILVGVLYARSTVGRSPRGEEKRAGAREKSASHSSASTGPDLSTLPPMVRRVIVEVGRWIRGLDFDVRSVTAVMGGSLIGLLLLLNIPTDQPTLLVAGIAAGVSLVAAGLAAIAARYLAGIDPLQFPESAGLCRGARVTAWILLLVAASVVLAWANLHTILRILYLLVLAVDAAVCYGLLRGRPARDASRDAFALDIGVLSVLGRRPNILASVLDAAEQQLGIDLRSTWALTIVRTSLEPLVICLCLAGWLSTSLTVVGMEEQGLVERLGVPLAGQPLQPGLHLHLPWPMDRVFRIPVERVQTIQVGHEGEEAEGPENVLWAVEHAPNEYTLLLGNGRDLITVDAAVQYRIVDARAWRYHSQNPAAALKAIAYRAVMRSTVDLTLSEALSQNVAILTGQIRAMVQKEADNLGLGVEVLGFTVVGMHPPVPVAASYEAVVSAQLEKVTSVVDAQVYRNQTVPAAESSVVTGENAARAEGAHALALASGQAWSFRALESQYRSSPQEYLFRRRLESMEKVLPERRYTVVDSRFLRAGGEIWMTR